MEEKVPLTRKQYLQQKKRKKRRKIISFVVTSMFLFMVGVITLFGYTYWKVVGAFQEMSEVAAAPVNTEDVAGQPTETPTEPEEERERPFAVALIGTDSRAGSGGSLNSDVLMVAFIDPERYDIHLLSIPRDLKMKIPGYSGYRKANQAYALGETKRIRAERKDQEVTVTGPSLVQDMLSEYLGVPIDYYVTVDFKGFQEIIDAVGGVEVNVQRHMVYDDPTDGTHIRLAPGVQTLDGKNALDYVRFRLDNNGNHASDLDRNLRQQEVVRAFIDKVTSFQGATKLGTILDAVAQNASTNFSVDDMKKFLLDIRSYSRSNIKSFETGAYWDSRQLFTIIPEENLNEIKKELHTFMNRE